MPRIGRPSPALIVSIIALAVAMTGTAVAANQIGGWMLKPHSVGGGKLKSKTIGGGKMKRFTGGVIKNESMPANRIRPKSLTSEQIDTAKLGPVPEAEKVAGEARYGAKIGFGQTTKLAEVGPFTLTGHCLQNTTDHDGNPGRDIARILISTSENGSVFESAVVSKDGSAAGELLNPTTAEGERIAFELSAPAGTALFGTHGRLTALAPSGVGITSPNSVNSAAINYAGSACSFNGAVFKNG